MEKQMRWSWRVGKIAGIDLYIHATFLFLIIWVVIQQWLQFHSTGAVLDGLAFILVLFGCVVLHEFGHALTARHFGFPTKDIVLLPIGGVSRFEKMPDKPWQEFWVAVAGPCVNVAIVAVIFLWLSFTSGFRPVSSVTMNTGPFPQRILEANISLILFNLIPAFPMDGGRILRALLATRLDHMRATQIAASVGQALALVFGLLGLFFNPFLLFIAFFVWIGAAQEAHSLNFKDALTSIPVRAAMQTKFETLSTNDTLGTAVKATLDTSHDFPVLWGDSVLGILTRSKLLLGLTQYGSDHQVSAVMEREFQRAEINELLMTALTKLASSACPLLPVFNDGQLVGIVTRENLGEYLMFQNALNRRPIPPKAVAADQSS
jgi:Zn-dependent protease/CBS domain-containing protein